MVTNEIIHKLKTVAGTHGMAMREYIEARIQHHYRTMESADEDTFKALQGQIKELRALEQALDTARTFK